MSVQAVLFDLDGTLADTAPDLGHALNRQREQHGLPPLPLDTIRPYASHGTPGLLAVGFGLTPDDPRFAAMRLDYLALYEQDLCRHTTLFPQMAALLDQLDARGIAWGVVTNKPARLTEPLLAQLALTPRAACIVSGDTTPHPKPHPAPMLHAARLAGTDPAGCLMLGDAERDVQAARAAGMAAVVARYGYLAETDRPQDWGAQGAIDAPLDLVRFLD